MLRAFFVDEANIELTIFFLHYNHRKERKQLQTDKKIGAEFFSRRFSLMQGTILGWIDVELEDDVFLKLMTANFLTVSPIKDLFKRTRFLSHSTSESLARD